MPVATAFANLVKVTTATTGTGTITLGSAVSGFRGSAALADGQTYAYTIIGSGTYEDGHGVYTASGTTLTRNVEDSSNSNALLSLAGGETVIIGHLLASDMKLSGGIAVSPGGLFAAETSLSYPAVTTNSVIIANVVNATYRDELDFDPIWAYAYCTSNGTLRVKIVSTGRMFSTYLVNVALV